MDKGIKTTELKVIQQSFEEFGKGQVKFFYTNKDNNLHNDYGPAQIEKLHEDGKLSLEVYYKNGYRHREDGPCSIRYYKNGNIQEHIYCLNNIITRLDGPAIINYHNDGSIRSVSYLIDGVEHDKENHWKRSLEIKKNKCNINVVEINGIKYKLTRVE